MSSPEEIKQKTREVYADDWCVIGPNDSTVSLEAYPVSCGIVTLYDPDTKALGMIHISFGSDEEKGREMVEDVLYSFRDRFGVSSDALQVQTYNMGDILDAYIKPALQNFGIENISSSAVSEGYIAMDVETGAVHFDNPLLAGGGNDY